MPRPWPSQPRVLGTGGLGIGLAEAQRWGNKKPWGSSQGPRVGLAQWFVKVSNADPVCILGLALTLGSFWGSQLISNQRAGLLHTWGKSARQLASSVSMCRGRVLAADPREEKSGEHPFCYFGKRGAGRCTQHLSTRRRVSPSRVS